MWDLSSADKPSVMIPGLATEWKVDESDKKKWTFKLRPASPSMTASPFNADAVLCERREGAEAGCAAVRRSQVGVTARACRPWRLRRGRRHDGE